MRSNDGCIIQQKITVQNNFLAHHINHNLVYCKLCYYGISKQCYGVHSDILGFSNSIVLLARNCLEGY